jgi:hypothetical protein
MMMAHVRRRGAATLQPLMHSHRGATGTAVLGATLRTCADRCLSAARTACRTLRLRLRSWLKLVGVELPSGCGNVNRTNVVVGCTVP